LHTLKQSFGVFAVVLKIGRLLFFWMQSKEVEGIIGGLGDLEVVVGFGRFVVVVVVLRLRKVVVVDLEVVVVVVVVVLGDEVSFPQMTCKSSITPISSKGSAFQPGPASWMQISSVLDVMMAV